MAASNIALHNDPTLCTKLLQTVEASVPLQILQSNITGAGSGLFVTKDVNIGNEIFRSSLVMNCVDDGIHKLVCDWCYIYAASKITSNNQFRGFEDLKVDIDACNGCKVCYYCSKVCRGFHLSATCADDQ